MPDIPTADQPIPVTPDVGQESPISDLTIEENAATIGSMPAAPSVTKAQLERDLLRDEKELAQIKSQKEALTLREQELEKDREVLKATLAKYFERGTTTIENALPSSDLDHLSIADACEVVFRDLRNEWLSLADLDTELRRRGKICSKGSIDIMFRGSDKFEVEKRGKKNFYRITAKEAAKNDVEDSHSRTTKR